MKKALGEARADLATNAPRNITMQIAPAKIGDVIGQK
jgi:polyribonucleotide nucleotidyltransferase